MAVRAFQAEYVDAVDAAETVLLPQLDQRLAAADPVRDACALAVQALYRPLYHRPDAARLSAAAWPAAFADLKRIQLDEPLAGRGPAPADRNSVVSGKGGSVR